jgi:hypothetical protein
MCTTIELSSSLIHYISDPYKDYFAERKEQKKERIGKNELQRLGNIARGRKQQKVRVWAATESVLQTVARIVYI